ncbi:hypothetical protein DSUL_20027 [Desulfovibrionales bacterium]
MATLDCIIDYRIGGVDIDLPFNHRSAPNFSELPITIQ